MLCAEFHVLRAVVKLDIGLALLFQTLGARCFSRSVLARRRCPSEPPARWVRWGCHPRWHVHRGAGDSVLLRCEIWKVYLRCWENRCSKSNCAYEAVHSRAACRIQKLKQCQFFEFVKSFACTALQFGVCFQGLVFARESILRFIVNTSRYSTKWWLPWYSG